MKPLLILCNQPAMGRQLAVFGKLIKKRLKLRTWFKDANFNVSKRGSEYRFVADVRDTLDAMLDATVNHSNSRQHRHSQIVKNVISQHSRRGFANRRTLLFRIYHIPSFSRSIPHSSSTKAGTTRKLARPSAHLIVSGRLANSVHRRLGCGMIPTRPRSRRSESQQV